MNTYVLSLLNYILICFECIMAAYLGGCFFRRRYPRTTHILAICILFVLYIVYLEFFGSYPVPKLLIGTVLHMVWGCLVFQANISKSSFLSLFLMSFWYIFDALCLIGISALIGIDYRVLINSPYAYFLLCFGVKVIELFVIVILSTFVKHHAKIWSMSWTDWLRILFFPFSSLLISFELVYMYNKAPDLSSTLTFCACILLLTDVMSVFLLEHLENQQLAIRNNAILQQDLKTERESINTWVEAYREERKRSHDFQNQLSVLRGMVEDAAPSEQFLQYLDSLLNIELPKTRYINTNRPVADVLLSQKATVARNRYIDFQMHLDDLSQFPLTDDELVVVLANLLDNAIAASERIHDEEMRRILVRIQCTPAVSYLYIENTAAESVVIKNNRVIIKQDESSGHGFGIQNVTTILDRRQALYAFEFHQKEYTFSFSAQIMAG